VILACAGAAKAAASDTDKTIALRNERPPPNSASIMCP
jgi:hypothetical protein